MEQERKCIRIEMEYDDGTIERATGEDANEIVKFMNGQAVMAYIHGFEYKGPKMQKVEK